MGTAVTVTHKLKNDQIVKTSALLGGALLFALIIGLSFYSVIK
jgi:hypothetical protein